MSEDPAIFLFGVMGWLWIPVCLFVAIYGVLCDWARRR